MARKPKERPHLRLRIEPELLARLEKARAKEGRTLTGEIVHRLEQSFVHGDLQQTLQKLEATANVIEASANAAVAAGPHLFIDKGDKS
jgi:hypothetical protein